MSFITLGETFNYGNDPGDVLGFNI